MVAHNGNEGDSGQRCWNARKPRLPLFGRFAVVNDIAHVDEKIYGFVFPRRCFGNISPNIIIGGLRVGKNYSFYFVFVACGGDFFPRRRHIVAYYAILCFAAVGVNIGTVTVKCFAVVGKADIADGNAADIVVAFAPFQNLTVALR